MSDKIFISWGTFSSLEMRIVRILEFLVCGETGTFATVNFGCTCAIWQGPIVRELTCKTELYQYWAVLWSSMGQCSLCAVEKAIPVSLLDFCAGNFQWFCHRGSKSPNFSVKSFTPSTTWIRLCTPLLSNSLCRFVCWRFVLQQNVNGSLSLLNVKPHFYHCDFSKMPLLSSAVPFAIDTLLSVRWCEYNSNTVWNSLSECVELEKDFFCILSIGDFLYFLMAFKKYVYHCFIFVTNTTEDRLVFSTCLCVPVHPQFCMHGLRP